jgi:hypothetical protein
MLGHGHLRLSKLNDPNFHQLLRCSWPTRPFNRSARLARGRLERLVRARLRVLDIETVGGHTRSTI